MIDRLMIALVLLSLLPACSIAPPDREPLRLRVLTYNIHHGEGIDGVFDYPRLADIINRAEPDLVALQEVDVQTHRSGGVDQAARLGELTGMHIYFGPAMDYQGGEYGNAVLSRDPIRAFYRHALPYDTDQEPRSAAVASVLPDEPWNQGLPLVFASTHLCHRSDQARLRQARSFIGHRAYDGPLTILAGDFNFTPDSAPYNALINGGWVDAAAALGNPPPTCPANVPEVRIDYVFVRPGNRWRIINVQVLDEPVASDHRPLLVELEYVHPRDEKS